jgi:uncharacterized protein YcaQ
MYKPAAKRRWGYFAMPVLHGDRMVGKVDAAADRKAGVLGERDPRGREVHRAMAKAVHAGSSTLLAEWLGSPSSRPRRR